MRFLHKAKAKRGRVPTTSNAQLQNDPAGMIEIWTWPLAKASGKCMSTVIPVEPSACSQRKSKGTYCRVFDFHEQFCKLQVAVRAQFWVCALVHQPQERCSKTENIFRGDIVVSAYCGAGEGLFGRLSSSATSRIFARRTMGIC